MVWRFVLFALFHAHFAHAIPLQTQNFKDLSDLDSQWERMLDHPPPAAKGP